MTYKILTDETQKVINRSSVRSALDPLHKNKRVDPISMDEVLNTNNQPTDSVPQVVMFDYELEEDFELEPDPEPPDSNLHLEGECGATLNSDKKHSELLPIDIAEVISVAPTNNPKAKRYQDKPRRYRTTQINSH